MVRAQAAKGERPDDVGGVGDALSREVHRRGERLEDLAGLPGALSRHDLRGVDVHRHGQFLRSGVPRARADHDIHRVEQVGRLLHGEVERLRRAARDQDPHRYGHVAHEACADRPGAGRHAPDLIGAPLAGGGAESGALHGDHDVREGGALGVGDAAPYPAGLGRQGRGQAEGSEDERGGDGGEPDRQSHGDPPGLAGKGDVPSWRTDVRPPCGAVKRGACGLAELRRLQRITRTARRNMERLLVGVRPVPILGGS